MLSYETSRVRLRPLAPSDRVHTQGWRNDPAIREGSLGYRFPVTAPMEDRWFEKALEGKHRDRVVFAMEDVGDDQLAGIAQLTRIDWIARVAWFGIVIGDTNRHGRGLARDAMTLLFDYAKDALDLRKICLEVAAYNTRAIQIYERFGFVQEGRLRDQIYLERAHHDLVLMGLFLDRPS